MRLIGDAAINIGIFVLVFQWNVMPLRAGEKKRRQILDAALAVIAAEGMDAITHRRVGRQADVSHGVVSYHFPTRESLIYKSFEHYFGSFEDYQGKGGWRVDQPVSSKRQLVEHLTDMVTRELLDEKDIVVEQEFLLLAYRNPDLAAYLRDWQTTGVKLLATGLKQSGYKNSKGLALALLNLMRGFLLECLTDPTLTAQDFKKRVQILLSSKLRTDKD